jgi:hypothetical protein
VILGLGIAGAGIVAAGVGAFFGAQALSQNSASYANGDCIGNVCNEVGYGGRNSARSDGDIATVLIGAGAAAIVGGVVVWLTAPRTEGDTSPGARVSVSPAGMSVGGSF